MENVINVVLQAGRSAVDVALYTLLPIMVVMMILMRILEATGILNRIVALLAPVAKPFGLTGMGVLAMFQISFVSFVAPLPTLALMEDRGASDRHLASALAAVLAMAPANAVFPLTAVGLEIGWTLALSVLGGLAAAAFTYWVTGGSLSNAAHNPTKFERKASEHPSLMTIINLGGAEAIRIVIKIIPMLLLSLVVVTALQRMGAILALESILASSLAALGLESGFILPSLTKYLAGSTALVGVAYDLARQGQLDPTVVSVGGAGFLLHPLDLPGVAILMSAGQRLGRSGLPAVAGGCVGIALRTTAGILFA